MSPLELAGLVVTGLIAGCAGGLFGIGGGVIIVPALYAVFLAAGAPASVCIKVAVGTSLATIIVTSIRSVQGHQANGNVEWSVLRNWAVWIGIGAVLGAALAGFATATALTLFFGVMLIVLAAQKLIGAGASQGVPARDLPSVGLQRGIGASIGTLSSLLGIGGGVLGVVTLTHFGRPVHRAVGTAAGFGLCIAVPGALGYMVAGWGQADMLPWTVGFVSVPAFLAIAAGTAVAAPWGAHLAARLSAVWLNRVFAAYMVVTGVVMITDALS